jgi:NADH-quinone oxidoreductase subunit C
MNPEILETNLDDYKKLVESLKSDGFEMMVDLTVVDWFRKKEPRFEIIVQLLSTIHNARKTIKVFVNDEDLTIPSITDIYPSANFYEREAYDMFGIIFADHPDLTRILMPDDWQGYPLRKNYSSGRIPVQFKNAPKVD